METSRVSVVGCLVAVALLAAPAFASGCSSARATGDMADATASASGEAGAPDAMADSSEPSDAEAPASGDASPDAQAGECSSEATQTKCITCCSTKHEDGATAYLVAALECMCQASNCAKDCAQTLCEPTTPKDADPLCQACLKAKDSACGPAIKAACTADPTCLAFDACVGSSGCQGMPN